MYFDENEEFNPFKYVDNPNDSDLLFTNVADKQSEIGSSSIAAHELGLER